MSHEKMFLLAELFSNCVAHTQAEDSRENQELDTATTVHTRQFLWTLIVPVGGRDF